MTILNKSGQPINPNQMIDDMIYGFVQKAPYKWRDLMRVRRKQVTDMLRPFSEMLYDVWLGKVSINHKTEEGAQITRVLADAAIQALLLERIEERKEDILKLEVETNRRLSAKELGPSEN